MIEKNLPRVLIVEDDTVFLENLNRSFTKRGYEVAMASNTVEAIEIAQKFSPEFAVVDLRMPGPSGLECVQELVALNPTTHIVVLTGFASITTAVEAIKLGACHYLPKPANTEDIIAAFNNIGGKVNVDISPNKTSLKNIEWEKIHQTLVETNFNVSETARRLGMHRRTLARKLEKKQIK